MKKTIAIVGLGEVGGVFARGFLKLGHPVFPVTRHNSVKDIPSDIESIIIAVGEKSLPNIIKDIPENLKDRLVLVQNELLPNDWIRLNITPTVISVWFEKKQPNDYKVIIPSPVYGSQAQLVSDALAAINISCKICNSEDELLSELIVKNLYILTVNIAGLKVGGTVSQLWNDHHDLGQAVANDVLDIQFILANEKLDRQKLIDAMVEAFNGDPDHKCMGRSAPARLERSIAQADEHGLEAKTLRKIQAEVSANK